MNEIGQWHIVTYRASWEASPLTHVPYAQNPGAGTKIFLLAYKLAGISSAIAIFRGHCGMSMGAIAAYPGERIWI
jgi:hypothetical protein